MSPLHTRYGASALQHRLAFLLLLAFLVMPGLRAQEPPTYYEKMDTWYETLYSAMMSYQVQAADYEQRLGLEAADWYVAGPFPANTDDPHTETFPPEVKLMLDDTYRGGTIRWELKPEYKDGRVNLFEPFDYSATFLYRTIKVGKDTTITFSMGSDDGIKVWLNGELLAETNVARAVKKNQEIIPFKLSEGRNTLLVKISNWTGDYGFYTAIANFDPSDIWDMVKRDFTGLEARTEINWEQLDGIWEVGFESGEVIEALAQNYVEAASVYWEDMPQEAWERADAVESLDDLWELRKTYLKARKSGYVILTPPAPPEPRINGAKVFGVRPGNPFLYKIPASGEKPVTYGAEGLPGGLTLDPASGIITGIIEEAGDYAVTFTAENVHGRDERRFTIKAGDTIGLTPPLGWNSWNAHGLSVTEEDVKAAADAMVEHGLIDYGWTYINIDDGYEMKPDGSDPTADDAPRLPDSTMATNDKFPDMKALGDYIHDKGLKFGIYSSPGPLTCGGYEASWQNEGKDAETFASWGVDYLKYDWCSYSRVSGNQTLADLQRPYRLMREKLDAVDRDIFYSLCQYGWGDVWEWGADVGGNSWRTTGDIVDTWGSMAGIGFEQTEQWQYAKPGHWNDPDMLVVGYVGWGPELRLSRLTADEQYTHISLWSLLSSPLLLGCDMRMLDDFTLGLLKNHEVLDVHQDPLGNQARRLAVTGDHQVWGKELADGSMAIGLFNLGETKDEVTLDFSEVGLEGEVELRDLWRQKSLGTHADEYTAEVNRHGVLLLKVTRKEGK